MVAKTAKERQEALRQRLAANGLAELRGVYAPIKQHVAIKQAIAVLQKNNEQIVKMDTKMLDKT